MAGAVWVKGATRNSQEKIVNLAKLDLAESIGIEPTSDKIKVLGVKAVTWKDPDLGYPKPGSKKTQGLVPGFLLFLEYSGRKYQYHTSLNRVILVPEGKGQAPLPANEL